MHTNAVYKPHSIYLFLKGISSRASGNLGLPPTAAHSSLAPGSRLKRCSPSSVNVCCPSSRLKFGSGSNTSMSASLKRLPYGGHSRGQAQWSLPEMSSSCRTGSCAMARRAAPLVMWHAGSSRQESFVKLRAMAAADMLSTPQARATRKRARRVRCERCSVSSCVCGPLIPSSCRHVRRCRPARENVHASSAQANRWVQGLPKKGGDSCCS